MVVLVMMVVMIIVILIFVGMILVMMTYLSIKAAGLSTKFEAFGKIGKVVGKRLNRVPSYCG